MGGYGGWGGGVNLGGYAPGAFYPNQITPVQPVQPVVQAPPVQAPQGGGYGGGGGGGGGYPPGYFESIAASNAADQAAQLVFQEWTMRTGDERLAMQKAQEEWQRAFSEKQQEFSEGVTEAGLLGTYEGQQTQAAQQQAWSQQFNQQQLGQQGALGVLGLQSQLQGPRDWSRYWGLAASAPQGLTSALSSLAGQYRFAPGAQTSPGPATLQSRTQDLLAGGQQGQPPPGAPASQGAPSGTTGGQAGGLPNPWQLNVQNYANMSPSMQQGVLGGYEAAGYFGPDVEDLLRRSAPRYSGPASAAIGL